MKTPPDAPQLLSLVIPCHNEQDVLDETVRQLMALCSALDDLDAELIFIDDGSTDSTRALLSRYAADDHRIRLICLARNFGHQIAVTAGLDASRGDAVVVLDADLQDPPEVVRDMVAKWREGFDVVYGTRSQRHGEAPFKLFTARCFYRLLNRLSEMPIPLDTGDFRLMSRPVVDTLRAMPERDRFIRGLVSWAGFRQTGLTYRRAGRFAGQSSYSLSAMTGLALDGILSFSRKPLRLSLWLGVLLAAISLPMLAYALGLRLFSAQPADTSAPLLLTIVLLGGVQLITVGILGEYIGRIYRELKQRPLYVVEKYQGFEGSPPTMSRSPAGDAPPRVPTDAAE